MSAGTAKTSGPSRIGVVLLIVASVAIAVMRDTSGLGDGQYTVGDKMQPGLWKTSGARDNDVGFCLWKRYTGPTEWRLVVPVSARWVWFASSRRT
jgi:hypothetical protein